MCMFCMVWCNSWYCLELHLLDSHHRSVCSETKAKQTATFNVSLAEELRCQDASAEEPQCEDTIPCDDSAIANWKKWKEESGLSVWCHKCGVILSGPDAADIHIQDHGLERSPVVVGKSHPQKVCHLSPSSDVFECACCTLSFKTTFSLMVHEAGFEHHRRIAKASYTDGAGWCAICGLLTDTKGCAGVAPCKKLNGLPSNESALQKTSVKCPAQLTCTTLQTMDPCRVDKCCHYMVCEQRKQENHTVEEVPATAERLLPIKTMDPCQVATGCHYMVCEERKQENHNLEEGSATAERLLPIMEYSTKVTADPDKPSCGPIPGQESCKGGGSSQGLVEDGTSIEPGLCSSSQSDKIVLTMGKAGQQSEFINIPAPAQMPINSGAGRSQYHVQQGPSLLTSELPDVSCSEVNNSSVDTRPADFGIPVVVAATVAPLGSLQESLQSIMTIVTEALSATLPMCTERPASLLKTKRHEHSENDEKDQSVVKKMRLMEAALHRSLQSVCSTKEDLDVKGSPQEDKLVSETELFNRNEKCCGTDTADHAAQGTRRTDIVHNSVDQFVSSVSASLNERAIFTVAASVMQNPSVAFARPAVANSQVVVAPGVKAEVGLESIGQSAQEKDDRPKMDVGKKISGGEESQDVPVYPRETADQGPAEKRTLYPGADQLGSLSMFHNTHCAPDSSLAFKKCNVEKEVSTIRMSSCPGPDSNGFNEKNGALLEVHKQLVQNPAGSEVHMPSIHAVDSEDSEDSCDYFAQLQYLKDQGYENWSSPSTDSEEVGECK